MMGEKLMTATTPHTGRRGVNPHCRSRRRAGCCGFDAMLGVLTSRLQALLHADPGGRSAAAATVIALKSAIWIFSLQPVSNRAAGDQPAMF
jgi:hypothetical protein